jgi:hypothetical protein
LILIGSTNRITAADIQNSKVTDNNNWLFRENRSQSLVLSSCSPATFTAKVADVIKIFIVKVHFQVMFLAFLAQKPNTNFNKMPAESKLISTNSIQSGVITAATIRNEPVNADDKYIKIAVLPRLFCNWQNYKNNNYCTEYNTWQVPFKNIRCQNQYRVVNDTCVNWKSPKLMANGATT